MTTNFCQALYENLLRNPEQVCLVWPQPAGPPRRYTGQELLRAVAGFRQQLAAQGVRSGAAVLVAVPVSLELVAALLGVMAHGAIPVLPPAAVSPWQLVKLLRYHQIRTAAVSEAAARRYGWLLRLVGVRALRPSSVTASLTFLEQPVAVPADQAALVSHSSGSTGQAKAIRRSHRVLTAQHTVLKAVFPPWLGQRDFPLFPNVLLHNLAVGAVSILPDIPWGQLSQFRPEKVVQQLQDEQVETLTGNVFYFRSLGRLLSQQRQALPHVKAVGIGGSPVPEWLLQSLKICFPHATIYGIYGSSEAEPIAVRAAEDASASPRAGYYVGPVVAGLDCQLRPCGQLLLPEGRTVEAGEILVRGAHVAAAGWLATGDFGYFDEQNHLWLTGRQGNAEVVRGVQHYQVEHVLQHLSGVEQVAAKPYGQGFAVYVQGAATEAAVRAALEAEFPPGLCAHVHFRAHLPLDNRHLSKVRYAALR
ncbi:AMP-binding protein [Hymenobacter sp. BT18]|uniref:AMP-binding protein n=1 Tax=Hymenobacter sp. BT18 TaxID=2835648 RepID=UPI00143E790D|nr:AMP-binding protein [Hymenobacter sp. BT18]QIX60535.1 AMP-binding protein [Hymenobacter sp. BT18]